VTLSKAGTRTTTLRISRRKARTLLRRGTFVQVLYHAGARAGVASVR
jgi:hypothetical protein